jgi:carboxymethylenebutenolidase
MSVTTPTSYDPASPNEVAPPLPSAPAVIIGPSSVLQPPLSRRGSGPGLIIILPSSKSVPPQPSGTEKPLDPEPLQKWAEEGFAVVAITLPENVLELTGDDATVSDVVNQIREGVEALKAHENVDTKDKFGLIIYDEATMHSLLLDAERLQQHGIVGVITFSNSAPESTASLPLLSHTSTAQLPESQGGDGKSSTVKVHSYPETTPHFVLPSAAAYNNAAAGLAHTRSLVFLRNHLGGPHFDLEAIWEEHCYWEFVGRSVARTMATMVVSVSSYCKMYLISY